MITEGIKYTGSKRKILPYILNLVRSTGVDSVFDGFSGSTRVSQALVKSGLRVHANDSAIWSYVFGIAYLMNKKERNEYDGLIRHLNSLEPVDGWFTENYGGLVTDNKNGNAIQSNGIKKPWQIKNTRKLDAIRNEIDNLQLNNIERCVALTSLILAMDKVENTIGHYSAYLKNWSKRSFKDLQLEVPMLWVNENNNSVSHASVLNVASNTNCDLAYYDPPYGSNNDKMPASRVRYAAYYHIWKTVIKNDQPELFGKANRRKDSSDIIASSVFEDFRKSDTGRFHVIEAIEWLIDLTPCEWIILSYSSGGRATKEDLEITINNKGKLKMVVKIDHQRHVMSSMKWTNEWVKDTDEPNTEFLFLIQKR